MARMFRRLMDLMGVRLHHLVISVLLSILVAGLDGVSLTLLAPLAEGIVRGDFAEVQSASRLVGWLINFLPFSFDTLPPAQSFFVFATCIFAFNAASVLVGYGNLLYGRHLQGIYQFRLHTLAYNRYLALGKRYFDTVSQGSIRKLLDYTTQIVTLVKVFQDSLTTVVRLFVMLGVMLTLSAHLFLFLLLVFPVLYALSHVLMRWVDTLWVEAKDVALEVGRESFNILSALPLVWSYSREDQARRAFAHLNERFRKIQYKAQVLGDLLAILPPIITLLTMFAIVLFITSLIERGQLTDVTGYVVFLYVASRTIPLFKVCTALRAASSELSPPIREILQLFDAKSGIEVPEGKVVFTGLQHSIEFRGLQFGYGSNNAVIHDFTFTVPKGSFVAVVGPSGSGKSTIINLLMRFYDCPPGTIFFDDVDIRKFTHASLRVHIALITQEAYMLHDTLRKNISYGLDSVSDDRMEEAITKAQLTSLIQGLPQGIDTMIGDRGAQLSGGEKQRVSIARALLKGADIMLFDEATSALDTETEQKIQQAIEKSFVGKTAIVIAHRLSTIRAANTIVYVDRGRIVETGSFEKLMEFKGAFYRQWHAQYHDPVWKKIVDG